MVTHLGLVGPTASGKSALALALAEHLGDVEIVSVDSMQVYRGMDIGTAKPTLEERARVPHHLVDVADPWEEWTVVRFRDAALAAVSGIEARGHRALFVGGTGLYLRAVIDGLDIPGRHASVREALELEADAPEGLHRLYDELTRVDPVAAARIGPGNRRRIVRALEVVRATGRPFSSYGPGLAQYGATAFPIALVGLRVEPAELSRRIARRFAAMRASGLVEEVCRLASHPRRLSRTARQAIGYQEVLDHLEGRVATLDEAFERAVRRTRAYARRQQKWFERDPRIGWIDGGDSDAALAALMASWNPCRSSA